MENQDTLIYNEGTSMLLAQTLPVQVQIKYAVNLFITGTLGPLNGGLKADLIEDTTKTNTE